MTTKQDGKGLGRDVWAVAIVVILGSVMSVLDTTIVNVALRTLARDFNTTLDSIQWVVTGYLLSLGAVVPVSGWAARRFGARRVFLISVVLFTLGSAACGLAGSIDELIGFRVLQGIGGGMLLPVSQMIMVKKAGPARLARVMSAVGVPTILAPIVGPTIGGALLDSAGWRWIFYVNVPVGIVTVVCAIKLLTPDRAEDAGPLDIPGLALVAAGMVGVTYGLAEIGPHPFASTYVLAPLVVGAVLTAMFCVRALHIPRPLLDMRLYANPGYSAAAVTTFCMGAVLLGGMILMPLYFQDVRGESPLLTGVLLMPQGAGAAAAMWLAGRLTDRIGAGVTMLFGGVINLAGTVPFALLGARTSFAALAGFMIVRGVGIGLCVMPAMTAAFRALRPAQVNDAAPQLNVLQRIGGSIGTALLAVVLQHGLDGAGKSPAREAAAFGHTFTWVLIVTAVGVLPVFLLIRTERAAGRGGGAVTAGAGGGRAAEEGGVGPAGAGAAAMEAL